MVPDFPTVPTQEGSPWPTFRHDGRNTGCSSLRGSYQGDHPWCFQTGKGIFSTPVIDADGAIYVGSADHFFYALAPGGHLLWKWETGEIIDSAAALGRYDPAAGCAPITVISGDGRMYHLRTGEVTVPGQRLLWTYESGLRPGISFNRWFEGNVAIGPDGTLYAGNTNFNYYAIQPDGRLHWTYSTGSNCWSQAAFGADGTIYWGGLDTFVRAVSPQGRQLWKRRTLGFVAASAAIGSDGTVYIGSFDSSLYALEPRTGRIKWKFPTGEHIYSSAALVPDGDGETWAILFGSADGWLYALRTDGSLWWKYNAGAPIRSSPAIGRSPQGGEIAYFGCGNGRLYAVDVESGKLRWSFDTTPAEGELRDRNDLNGSPALGQAGVYIGGEHGQVWYIPYDYPLHVDDPRGQRGGDEVPLADEVQLLYVSPGGNTQPAFPERLAGTPLITLRLVAPHAGETIESHLYNSPLGRPHDALQVALQPSLPLEVEHSADGRYIHIRPMEFLQAGQTYTLRVRGRTYAGGRRLGNLTLGGRPSETFDQSFTFTVQPDPHETFLFQIDAVQNTAIELTRLAAPLPVMLPSLNQIGFDYMDWIVGAVDCSPGAPGGESRVILWCIGARRNERGELLAGPQSDFTLPLAGRQQGNDFILSNRDFALPITGIRIPFHLFELRGRWGADGVAAATAAYADTEVLSIPNFGIKMAFAGLANDWYKKLLVAGTYVTRPYAGPANRTPGGVRANGLSFQPPGRFHAGQLAASFQLSAGARCPLSEHRPGLLLVDADRFEPVFLDYHHLLSAQANADGDLARVTLSIPRCTRLPRRLVVYVLLDVYPLAREELLV